MSTWAWFLLGVCLSNMVWFVLICGCAHDWNHYGWRLGVALRKRDGGAAARDLLDRPETPSSTGTGPEFVRRLREL